LKVKAADVQPAMEIIKKNYMKSTGLNSDAFLKDEAVFNSEAETVICPACSAAFKPTSHICPDCGLQFG
jgi:rRNA maturation endonuclease Nob1